MYAPVPSPHLAVELLVQQDVPGSNVSVDKGLTSQVRQTLSHLAAELEQCDREGWVSRLRSTTIGDQEKGLYSEISLKVGLNAHGHAGPHAVTGHV